MLRDAAVQTQDHTPLPLLCLPPQFLELCVGHRAERPLPPPAQAAATLRETALQLLQVWDQQHGARHKQVLAAAWGGEAGMVAPRQCCWHHAPLCH